MKTCPECKKAKLFAEFNKCVSRKDGRQTYCKLCQQDRERSDWSVNEVRRRNSMNRTAAARIRNKAFIADYLSVHPCVDCDEDDIVVLDFDHVRGVKSGNVVDLAIRRSVSLATLIAEIEKCEVRCANCHRRRTAMTRHHKAS